MKRKIKEWIKAKLFYALWITIIVLTISAIIAYVYALIAYGGKPVSEVPTWALWLLFSGKGR